MIVLKFGNQTEDRASLDENDNLHIYLSVSPEITEDNSESKMIFEIVKGITRCLLYHKDDSILKTKKTYSHSTIGDIGEKFADKLAEYISFKILEDGKMVSDEYMQKDDLYFKILEENEFYPSSLIHDALEHPEKAKHLILWKLTLYPKLLEADNLELYLYLIDKDGRKFAKINSNFFIDKL